jgi:hypothetical protein
VSADLDALDRGVIEAGQLAAEALSRVCALEAEVARLTQRVEMATSAEAVMRRANLPEPVVAAAGRQARRRSRHLKRVQ